MTVDIEAVTPSTVWQVPEAFRNVYSHATSVSLGTRMLFVSGQFGVRPDGALATDFRGQAEQAMANVEALLSAAEMGLANLVKTTFFLTRSTDAPELVALRAENWGGPQPPAVTVLTVSALARPEYLIEIEATAVA